MNKSFIGIDIGGTKCAVIFARQSGERIEILKKAKFETVKGCKQTIEKLFLSVDAVIFESNIKYGDITAIGISCGGPLDSKKGIIQSPPNLPGWDNIHIKELFESRYGINTYLQNDANAGMLAEWTFGAAKGCENAVFLTFGTGIGAGLLLNGKLYEGTSGMAGEIGHVRLSEFGPVGYGKEGSVEGFCSGGGIVQLAKIKAAAAFQNGDSVGYCRTHDEYGTITAKSVADAAAEGDKFAIEVYELCGRQLGRTISVIIDFLNPEAIVIGGIYGRSCELLQQSVLQTVEKEALKLSRKACKIVPAFLGEKIGDYAAISVASSSVV